RGRAHVARLPRRAARSSSHGTSLQRLWAWADRRRRDSRIHRGGARRRESHGARRRLADPRVVLRRRHGRSRLGVPRAPERRRPELQHRQSTLGGDDLRPGTAGETPDRLPRRDRVRTARLRRRRASDPERHEGARGDRFRSARRAGRGPREDDCVVSQPETGADVVRLARPDVGEAELAEIREVLESGQLTMGAKVAELEELVARAAGTSQAVAVSSGTAALHLAVLALGIGPGDEVLVPAYTFPATGNVVALAGAVPVLVDVDPVTMNIDPADAARRVTPRTKAVLAVHLFGRPAR